MNRVHHRSTRTPALGLCLLLLALTFPGPGSDAAPPSRSCLPRYGDQQFILRVNETSPLLQLAGRRLSVGGQSLQ